MMCARTLPVFLFLLSVTWASAEEAQTNYVATNVKVDPVMQPKQPGDVFKECANNPACSAALKGAASYLGVSPTLVTAVLAIIPLAKREGEEGHFTEMAYRLCAINLRSIRKLVMPS